MVNIIHYSLVVYYLFVGVFVLDFLGLIILKIIYLQKVYL